MSVLPTAEELAVEFCNDELNKLVDRFRAVGVSDEIWTSGLGVLLGNYFALGDAEEFAAWMTALLEQVARARERQAPPSVN